MAHHPKADFRQSGRIGGHSPRRTEGKEMKFTTGEVISAGLGKLCCDMEGVYRIMNFLTGDSLFTHQLPRAFRACEAWVKEQHPWLNQLDDTKCNRETWRSWLADAERRFGKEHELKPLPADQWMSVNPIQEAIEIMEDKSKVIAVRTFRNSCPSN
jgi:hypothetical protein